MIWHLYCCASRANVARTVALTRTTHQQQQQLKNISERVLKVEY